MLNTSTGGRRIWYRFVSSPEDRSDRHFHGAVQRRGSMGSAGCVS